MSETKQSWCDECDELQTFYQPEAGGLFLCSMCEKPLAVPSLPPAPEAPVGEAVGDGTPLQDDLDHIRIQLSGPWSNEDLKNLAADLQMSSDGAKEGGLGLAFFAVKKTAAQKARDAGGIIVPFRDRHGKIMLNTPPLSFSPNKPLRVDGGKP